MWYLSPPPLSLIRYLVGKNPPFKEGGGLPVSLFPPAPTRAPRNAQRPRAPRLRRSRPHHVGQHSGRRATRARAMLAARDHGGGGDDDAQGLVHRFVTEAMLVANVTLQPWIQKYCAYFDDSAETVDAKGETLEQYKCYQIWCARARPARRRPEIRGARGRARRVERVFGLGSRRAGLDKELQHFVQREGFASAAACHDAIASSVKADKARQEAAVAAVLAQLRASEEFRALVGAADGGGGGAKGDGPPPLSCFVLLPVAAEEMVSMALRLGEYETFSAMMRATVRQLRAERAAGRGTKLPSRCGIFVRSVKRACS